ncbi:MAG: hypothetical protein K940chlam9_00618 [Chlamydiae bacterium]|nr:hypothetical protein [Chlamydiota bacterium]
MSFSCTVKNSFTAEIKVLYNKPAKEWWGVAKNKTASGEYFSQMDHYDKKQGITYAQIFGAAFLGDNSPEMQLNLRLEHFNRGFTIQVALQELHIPFKFVTHKKIGIDTSFSCTVKDNFTADIEVDNKPAKEWWGVAKNKTVYDDYFSNMDYYDKKQGITYAQIFGAAFLGDNSPEMQLSLCLEHFNRGYIIQGVLEALHIIAKD